jgi:hypothetical protein
LPTASGFIAYAGYAAGGGGFIRGVGGL